jgi:hypothetical protein
MRAALPRLRDRLRLGDVASGVSPVCLGMVGDPRVVPAAFDAGANFFFLTADMHWPLYEPLRRGLAMLLSRGGGVRDEVVVGVVSYVTQPEFCLLPFREVIDAVAGLSRIDLTLLGGSYAADFAARRPAYQRHREGAIPGARATGASFHDRLAAREAIAGGEVDVAFLRYNAEHRGAEEDLFPAIEAIGAPRRALVYAFKTTSGHLDAEARTRVGLTDEDWQPHVTDRYRFALGRPEIDGVLCALDEERHVAELDEALAKGPLDEEDAQYLRDLGDLSAGRATLVGRG